MLNLIPQDQLDFHYGTEPLDIANALATRLASTAVERDQRGGHAAQERQWIRDSGLLTLTIPRELGGQGANWETLFQVVRRLAQVDSALAHVFAFHHLQLASIDLYGSASQRTRFLRATVEQGLFWGNALNPLDKRVIATENADGYLLDGLKSFSSGSVGSDWLTFTAWHAPTESALIGMLPSNAAGIEIRADWDAFGQKQTDSGTVVFSGVQLPHDLVLQAPGKKPGVRATVRTQIAQLVLANLYLGIGQGAFGVAKQYTREFSRPWFDSGVRDAADDPYIQHRYGELWLLLRPAEMLVNHAAQCLDRTLAMGEAIQAEHRGELAIAVAEAKCLAHRAGLEVSSQMFELAGARATSGKLGLDRFWRNIRVHTLHDPIDYKLRDVGRYALCDTYPEATPYS